jgi:L,D-transpeptidase YbiS
MIHGTLYERSLGLSVTHGCVRVGAEDLEAVYKAAAVGTKVYLY